MSSNTRPEQTTPDGIVHRHACPTPPPKVMPATMRGWCFYRCPSCGAARLERVTRTPQASQTAPRAPTTTFARGANGWRATWLDINAPAPTAHTRRILSWVRDRDEHGRVTVVGVVVADDAGNVTVAPWTAESGAWKVSPVVGPAYLPVELNEAWKAARARSGYTT